MGIKFKIAGYDYEHTKVVIKDISEECDNLLCHKCKNGKFRVEIENERISETVFLSGVFFCSTLLKTMTAYRFKYDISIKRFKRVGFYNCVFACDSYEVEESLSKIEQAALLLEQEKDGE